MNIDELIEKLHEIKKEEGNLEIEVAIVRSTYQHNDGFTSIPVSLVMVSQSKTGTHRDLENDPTSLVIMGVKEGKRKYSF